MIKKVVNFSNEIFGLEISRIGRYLKPYSKDIPSSFSTSGTVALHRELNSLFFELRELFLSLSEAQGIISLFNITATDQGLIDDQGKCIFPYQHPLLIDASWASFFSLALSTSIDEWILELFKSQEYIKAYLLEAIALSALSQMEKKLRQMIRLQIPNEYTLSYTLTPGSHGLPLNAIKEALNLSGGRQIGISHGSELSLSPLKAMTGVVFAGAKFRNTLNAECDYCGNKENCLYRI